MGRTKLLQIFVITHSSAMGKATSLLFQEATYFILYPQSCSYHSLKYILKEKVGLSTEDIKRVKQMKSKYVVINNKYPKYIISGHTIELI